MGKEGPKFTFNKEKVSHQIFDEKELLKREKSPKVGQYFQDIKYMASSPQYTFSRLLRSQSYNTNEKYNIKFPGPEKYNPNKEISSTLQKDPVWSIGKGREEEKANDKGATSDKNKEEMPGPGQYNSNYGNMPQGPQYTFRIRGKKFVDIVVNFSPGPGKYSVNFSNRPTEPYYTMGKFQRTDEEINRIKKDNYPGPGKYKVKDSNTTRAFTFSKAPRKQKKKDQGIPGPGKYRIPTSFDNVSNLTREGASFSPVYRYI